MPELLLELFSEEIPARLQSRGAEDLGRLLTEALKAEGLAATDVRLFHGPRRLTYVAELPAGTAAETREERGPRQGAPAQAVEAFIRGKVAAPLGLAADFPARAAAVLAGGGTVSEGGAEIAYRDTGKGVFLLASLARSGRATTEVLAKVIPALLWRFPWAKSMRWGGTSSFIWVRPLKRILCLFDGAVVPFALAQGDDDGHGLASGNLTEGHRIMAPGAFAVQHFSAYVAELQQRFVVLDPGTRAQQVRDGVAALAAAKGWSVLADEGLVTEVAGLVEWPMPLLGRIDDAFMDLPPELMRSTMRVNQRYFALRDGDKAAPGFAFVSNIAAEDGGAAVSAGNERVLRARLSDARFFWDLDRKQALDAYLPKLDSVVFHAKLGTQGARVARLEKLAAWLAPKVGADATLAARAAKLAKADLATGLVGEFPELQGIIGRYYALATEDSRVAEAIAAHYRPMGPTDAVPTEPVAIAVALADKLDQITGFFAVGEKPTGSGDPFALRRAALGVIRILRENNLALGFRELIGEAFFTFPQSRGATATPDFGMDVAAEKLNAGWQPPQDSAFPPMVAAFAESVFDSFIRERFRVMARGEGFAPDVIAAAFGTQLDDNLVRVGQRLQALQQLLASPAGADLRTAYGRGQNILRIEEKKDGPHAGPVDPSLLDAPDEKALVAALDAAEPAVAAALAAEDFPAAMAALAGLRGPVDAFFTNVVVNDPDSAPRRLNRLRLLARLRGAMNQVADFAKIES